MKITIKTLQQKQFHLEAEPEDTILTVKQKIEESQGHAVSLQKLIFSGKVLDDGKSLSSYNITEKDFLVVMVSKPPAKPNVSSSSNSGAPSSIASTTTPQPNLTSSAPPPTVIHPPIAPITSTPSTQESEPAPTSTPASSTPTTNPQSIQSHFGNESALLTGTDYTNAIQNIVEMGFDRDQVVKAMRASFNNPARAVEYLMNGIPESVQNEQIPAASDLPGNQPVPPTTGNTGTATPALPPNLLQAAALAQQSQPQFQQLRQLVQQNPAQLPNLLQLIGQNNPQLLQFINANQSAFTRLLLEGGRTPSQCLE
ncbi:17432_t:CDS:2, partial [Dentiscutata heterogama]